MPLPHPTPLLLLIAAACIFAPLISAPSSAQAAGTVPTRLRCEYREDPLGVDSTHPRLEWILQADPMVRGVRQTAYRLLVASSPALLEAGHGDLWDSGMIASRQMSQIAYAGKPLHSGQQCWWKVRVVDQTGRQSSWSALTSWTMGLLQEADWHKAQWIGAASTTENTALIGYHAAETRQQDDLKWVQADLGRVCAISAVRLSPMQHSGKDGFGFPVRFKVEAASNADFRQPITIADQTAADYPNPGALPVTFPASQVTARYVRVTATRLWLRDAAFTGTAAYAFALHRIEVDSAGQPAPIVRISAKDSVEASGWGEAALLAAPPTAAGKSASTDSLLLRRRFVVKPHLTRALAFVCGLGQYELTLNGNKVGDHVLSPGWTLYSKTCLYDTYDITAALHPGPNAVGLFLGNGMYHIHPGRYTKITGSFGPQRAIGLLRLTYADGTTENIGTDEHWKAGAGPITFSSIYGGEDYDARRLPANWDRPEFNDTSWDKPIITPGPGGTLMGLSCAGPPIRAFGTLTPVSHKPLNSASTVYDLGQNASLMLRLRVRGPIGSSVRITPSELVGDTGDINDTMCGGDSYWDYTLGGRGEEAYRSRFYYRGGRYLKVDLKAAPGSTTLPVVDFLGGDVIRADAPVAGQFSCSSELYNKVYHLVRWAQMSNMVSIMTDCPTREKLGWLEEDHLNGPALRYNFDLATLMTKMAGDMADSQRPNGLVPSTCPDYPHWDENPFVNPPEWGSACIAVPWQQYQFEGDLDLLRRSYPMMKHYIEYLDAKANNHIVNIGLGDWYDNQHNDFSTLTPIALTATAFYYYDTQTLVKIATLLGKTDEAAHYAQQGHAILAAYNRKFFNDATNNYATGSQASNAFPLAMGLVEPAHRPAVLENLTNDLKARGTTAGEVSLKYVLEVLAQSGNSDLIHRVYGSEKSGYGFQVKRGQTSLSEGWNGSSSQNHFMFGQINEWFYRFLAGIQDDPAGPGFRKIIIQPALVRGLTSARASYDSRSGLIISEWKRSGGAVTLSITIPANTTATVYMPTHDPHSILESGKPVSQVPGVALLRSAAGTSVFAVGSGHYVFTAEVSLE